MQRLVQVKIGGLTERPLLTIRVGKFPDEDVVRLYTIDLYRLCEKCHVRLLYVFVQLTNTPGSRGALKGVIRMKRKMKFI